MLSNIKLKNVLLCIAGSAILSLSLIHILKINVYRDFLQTAGQTARRATRSEIKIFSTVDVAVLQKTVDQMSRQLRLLDNKLQQTNWSTDL